MGWLDDRKTEGKRRPRGIFGRDQLRRQCLQIILLLLTVNTVRSSKDHGIGFDILAFKVQSGFVL